MIDDLDRVMDLYSFMARGGPDERLLLVTIPGLPPTKARARVNTRTGRMYDPKENREAEKATAGWLRLALGDDGMFTGNVALACVFYRPTFQRIDTDNMLKHVCDAATGVVWKDDSQVTAIYGQTELDATDPRTVIVIGNHASTMTRGSDDVVPCEMCGAPVARESNQRKTCSAECATRLRGYRPLSVPVNCDHCGRLFLRVAQAQRLCSAECRQESFKGKRREAAAPRAECQDCGLVLTHTRPGRCRDCWRKWATR